MVCVEAIKMSIKKDFEELYMKEDIDIMCADEYGHAVDNVINKLDKIGYIKISEVEKIIEDEIKYFSKPEHELSKAIIHYLREILQRLKSK